MVDAQRKRSAWLLRLVWVFSGLLGLLCYWLLTFMVDDIGSRPGPDYATIERAELDPTLTARRAQLVREIEEVRRQIAEMETQQNLLQDSTRASQQTMNQLIDLRRLSLEKEVAPAPAEQEALAEAEHRFLENQRQYQQMAETVARQNLRRVALDEELRGVESSLEVARQPLDDKFRTLNEQHHWKLAAWKLSLLVPLLLIGALISWRLRGGPYAAMAYAFALAVGIKVFVVMHHHFPAQYFKYILIGTLLIVVIRVLVHLLRMMAHPKVEMLVKQYREAYEAFLCPVCAYPIRRGPWRFLAWTRSSVWKIVPPVATGETEEPYTCPVCTHTLYEKCTACGGVRPSLLTACPHCGNQRPVPRLS